MASRFERVDDEYIEELKHKSENENTNNSTKWRKNVFKKWARKATCKQIQFSPRPTIVAVLSIQNFINFVPYFINK